MALRFTLGGFPQFTGISRVSRKAETNSCLLIASIIVGTLDVAFTSLKWNIVHKGQIKPKADWRAIDSPTERTNKCVLFFAMTVQKYLKLEILISSFKYFWTVKQKKKKMVRSVFGRIYGMPICFRFYLTCSNEIMEGWENFFQKYWKSTYHYFDSLEIFDLSTFDLKGSFSI